MPKQAGNAVTERTFVPFGVKKVNEAGVIKSLIDKYNYESLAYKFRGDTHILYQRYIEREKIPERGDANRDFTEISYNSFDEYCRNLEAFDIDGRIIGIDTTDFDKVDFTSHIEAARLFVKSTVEK